MPKRVRIVRGLRVWSTCCQHTLLCPWQVSSVRTVTGTVLSTVLAAIVTESSAIASARRVCSVQRATRSVPLELGVRTASIRATARHSSTLLAAIQRFQPLSYIPVWKRHYVLSLYICYVSKCLHLSHADSCSYFSIFQLLSFLPMVCNTHTHTHTNWHWMALSVLKCH